MKKAMLIALCAVATISFNGCKKETTANQVEKQAKQRDNYVQKQANKYTQSITGAPKATEKKK